ncbi:MAG: hypothetical protein HKM28_03200 [Flavobacteriaceae bacterium]|nr:hypothetical protein [Flavobacteriaceae bacterium]
MLTSFFGKSNPVNYLILGAFIVIGYFLSALYQSGEILNFISIAKHFGWILLSLFLMFLLDFVIRKNSLTKNHTYAIYFFCCMLLMVPAIVIDNDVLIANVFGLLALRRILSFRTERNTEKKILDASLYLTLATLFHFWIILYFVVLWIGILRVPGTRFRHLLIPVVGFFSMGILITTGSLLIENNAIWLWEWFETPSFDFSLYHEPRLLIATTLLIGMLLWTLPHRLYTVKSLQKSERPTVFLVIASTIVAFLTALLSAAKTGAELLFLCIPASILFANYIAFRRSRTQFKTDHVQFWFKEALLWLFLLTPLISMIVWS